MSPWKGSAQVAKQAWRCTLDGSISVNGTALAEAYIFTSTFFLIVPLVAFAVIPPTALSAIGDTCPDDDQSGGISGQSGSCTFTCKGFGLVYIEITADDTDAEVSGTGECGTAHVSCGPQEGSCSDSEKTTAAGAGTCSGSSSELIDSGLKVNCYWDPDGEDPEPREQICELLPQICNGETDLCNTNQRSVIPACDDVAPLMDEAVEIAKCRSPVKINCNTTSAATSSAHIYVQDNVAVGAVCDRTLCHIVPVACGPSDNGLTCTVRW